MIKLRYLSEASGWNTGTAKSWRTHLKTPLFSHDFRIAANDTIFRNENLDSAQAEIRSRRVQGNESNSDQSVMGSSTVTLIVGALRISELVTRMKSSDSRRIATFDQIRNLADVAGKKGDCAVRP